MIIDYTKNLMPKRNMLPPTECKSVQSSEVEDLATDYQEFCQHLIDEGNFETVSLMEFAIWRNQEFEAQDDWTNPIPSIN
tara:strand:- start:790 stop:1029 length:240 start_codon:yes stop_codon:yes gene_type:complete